MSVTYEQWAVACYAARLSQCLDSDSAGARQLCKWVEQYAPYLGLERDCLEVPKGRDKGKSQGKRKKKRKAKGGKRADLQRWENCCRVLGVAAAVSARPHPEVVDRNVQALSAAFALDMTEAAILAFLVRYDSGGPLESLCDGLVQQRVMDSDGLLSACLGLPLPELRRLVRKGPLRSAGLIVGANGRYRSCFGYDPCDRLAEAVQPPNEGLEDIERSLLGRPLPASLCFEDFAHLAQERNFVAALLRGAVERPEKGINILLYGPTGAGKTEFCKTIADHLCLSLYSLGEDDGDNYEPSRYDRLAELRLVQGFAQRKPRTVLLFDEMEDLLGDGHGGVLGGGRYRRVGSKVFVNRLLEENPVPVLWTVNDISAFDPALLRRMTFALRMRVPPVKVRRRTLGRLCADAGLATTQDDIDILAGRLPAAPGVMANAVRATRLAGTKEADLRLAAEALVTATRQGEALPRTPVAPAEFDPALVKADLDVMDLQRKLTRPGAPRNVSLCLYGPPGTGKSAYLRQLAEAMELEVHYKRASDLLSKWVGESEQNIAEAFREAREGDLFLILDEADSLLGERGGAGQSWEVSQVNEMLTWMEDHPQPFACTTNLMERLDRAALRRFTFKIEFGYLTRAQAEQAFRRFFDLPAPVSLAELTCLTPADFALTAKKLRFLEEEPNATLALRLLERECALKPGWRRPIGFVVGGAE